MPEAARTPVQGPDGAGSERSRPAESPAALEVPARSARLALNQSTTGRGPLDGGWWPRSRGASTQLTDLVTALNDRFGVILRLTVDTLAWDEMPHRITVAGHMVRVGRYTDTSHVIVVTLSHREQLRLLVVPPLAAEPAALAALAMCSRPGDLSAQDVLEHCGIETAPITRLSARPIASAA